MKRTQIQMPDLLFAEVQRVAELQEWSVTEVLRRGAEYMIRRYPPEKSPDIDWSLPEARELGGFLAPVEDWRELATESRADDRSAAR